MKKQKKERLSGTHSESPSKCSLERAVEYLINEYLRLKDVSSAKILSEALADLKSQKGLMTFANGDEESVIKFLREFLKLNEEEKYQIVSTLKEYSTNKVH